MKLAKLWTLYGRTGMIVHGLFESRRIIPAEPGFLLIQQQDIIIAIKARPERMDLINIEDSRAVNAQKLIRIELSLD